jgi:superfamily II DNA/RNA helicase
MKEPVLVDLTKGQKHKLPTNIEHFMTRTNKSSLPQVAKHFIDTFNSERCIVFTNRKLQAAELSQRLSRMGLRSADLHSDISQSRREMILDKFRKGSIKVICATDVAARGIDIPEIDLILHVEAPQNGLDFYIHRSGRTGRAGRPGKSVIIDTGYNSESLSDLSRVIKFKKLEVPSEILNASRNVRGGFEMDNDEDNNRGYQTQKRFTGYSRDSSKLNNLYDKGSQFNSSRKFDRFDGSSGGSGGGFKQRNSYRSNDRNFDD